LDGYFSLKWITIVKRTTTASQLEEASKPSPLRWSLAVRGEFLVAPLDGLHYNSPWFKPKSKTEEKTAVK
jgi:hypothetical protein